MTEAQKTLYYIAENMKMEKKISDEGYEHFQLAIKALEQPSGVEDLLKEVCEQERWLSDAGYNAYNVDIAFKSIVRAIQALPPVTPTHGTCKDCKHCYMDEDGCGYHCEKFDYTRFPVYADFYCADYEKRGNKVGWSSLENVREKVERGN